MKYCPSCKTEKELTEFPRDKYTNDGWKYECKLCCIKRMKKYQGEYKFKKYFKAKYGISADTHPKEYAQVLPWIKEQMVMKLNE